MLHIQDMADPLSVAASVVGLLTAQKYIQLKTGASPSRAAMILAVELDAASSSGELMPTTEEELASPSSSADHLVNEPVNDTEASVLTYADELQASWVYRRNHSREDSPMSSDMSTTGRTASWSMLSGISLFEIFNIAVLSLPINRDDIGKHERYVFGGPQDHQENSP